MLDSFGFPLFAVTYILKNVFCWFPIKLHAFTHLLIFFRFLGLTSSPRVDEAESVGYDF